MPAGIMRGDASTGDAMKRISIGSVMFPSAAIFYAAYMMHEQLSDPRYHSSTISYAVGLGIVIIGLAAIAIVQEIWGRDKSHLGIANTGETVGAPDENKPVIISYPRRISVALIACISVYFFDVLGYAISFYSLTILTLFLLNVRSYKLLVGIPIATVIVVHYLFVTWLEMPLPRGLLGRVF
jgi:Tripartite tricarboxylate transporter TctB family/Aromatic acid exporter family member 1